MALLSGGPKRLDSELFRVQVPTMSPQPVEAAGSRAAERNSTNGNEDSDRADMTRKYYHVVTLKSYIRK
jgi:hypothetical protein